MAAYILHGMKLEHEPNMKECNVFFYHGNFITSVPATAILVQKEVKRQTQVPITPEILNGQLHLRRGMHWPHG